MRILLFSIYLYLVTQCYCDRACSRNTCLNGGTCTVNDETRMFQCECPVGFSGLLCQDNCSLHCLHGSCVKGTFDEETCQCYEGWMGSLCDISAIENQKCKPECKKGEKCSKLSDGGYSCQVNRQQTVSTTESSVETTKCEDTTCQNNGTCIQEDADVKCVCSSGFTGKACEQDIDECQPDIEKCKNGGKCENLYGSYKCNCFGDFSGKNCEVSNKLVCPENYCKNGGKCSSNNEKLFCDCLDGYEGETCENKVKNSEEQCKCDNPAHECRFSNGTTNCACPEGFTGPDCQEQSMKPCDMEPCLNGGHCVDDGNNLFTCFCLPHWTGVYCGEPVECLVNGSNCQNGGRCVFALAMTSCECLDGFSGANCELSSTYRSHPGCSDTMCQNGGSCKIDANTGDPLCECPDGFEPPFCEPKSECARNPCKNNGLCQDADGQYFCHCQSGFTGVHCEEIEASTIIPTVDPTFLTTDQHQTDIIDDFTCEDCVHTSNCYETDSKPVCICESGYFGAKCDQKYDKCSSVSCPNGEVCVQYSNGSDKQNITAQCACPVGHFGENCSLLSSATFSSKSLFIHQSSKFSLGTSSFEINAYELEFSFRTTVEDTHLASSENILGEKILSINLVAGMLNFNTTGSDSDNAIPMRVNDGQWYTVNVKSERETLNVEVKTENGFVFGRKTFSFGMDVFLTRFGKISSTSYFIGCLADVRIDGELIVFTDSKRAIQIRKGCTRNKQCSRDYCQHGGVCMDHWESSSCKCKPPFLKPTCAHSLPKSTFGHSDQPSIVHLSTSELENHLLRNEIELSFLIRSRKPDAFLFYIGEKHNNADVLANYLIVKISNGAMSVRYRTGGKKEIEFHSKNRVDDNEEHHVQIRVDRNRRQITIDNLLETSETINLRSPQEFYVDDILIGSSSIFASNDEYFKGYMQDIQLNDKSIVIHPTSLTVDSMGKMEKVTNIIEGSVSDPICNSSVCKYGECTETFNDFECRCSDGFTGRLCDKIDYCKDSKCLDGSKCQNIDNGHYCVFPVTISNESRIEYELKSKTGIMVPKISFSIRTHSTNGHVFSLVHAKTSFKVMLFKRKLLLINEAQQKINMVVSDGKWHKVLLTPHKVTVDGFSYVSTTALFNVDGPAEAKLFIGKQMSDPIFACFDNFTIGNYPMLSFTKHNIPTKLESWKLIEKTAVGTGCISVEQCGIFSTCLNAGSCKDIWNKRKCVCVPGFSGENCEENVNECKFIDCGKNGYCIDQINEAKCVCNNGFHGDRCENSDNECEGFECHNDGKCMKSFDNSIQCQCKELWMGDHCNITKTTDCKTAPCQNFGKCIQKSEDSFECNCVEGYSGEFCETRVSNQCNHYDCNRGHCVMTVSGPACQCDFGFTGRFCEKFINYCTSNTCSSRGACTSTWNATTCNCEKNWRGAHCQYSSDTCLDFPCQNDGVCSTTDDNSFKCKCQKYYMGSRCELEGSCLNAKCVNGECIQSSSDHHTCSCNIGYEGNACDKRIDYCKAKPCLNEGTCENMLTGYKCSCPVGFEGSDCEVNIDECGLGYCGNGAKCRDMINDYECICDGTGYEGKNCTIDVNECENPKSCINGECSNTLGGYKCGCRNGFIGPRCSLKNPCAAQISSNNVSSVICVHGKCVNPVVNIENNREVAKYECSCDYGYTGPTCSQKIKKEAMSNIGYLFAPIVVIVVVLTILGCLLLLFVIKGNNAMHGHYSPSSHEYNQNRMAMPTVIKLPPQERLI